MMLSCAALPGHARPSVCKRPVPDYGRSGEFVRVAGKVKPQDIRTKRIEVIKICTASCNLEEAEIIVSGGWGMCKPENFPCSDRCTGLQGSSQYWSGCRFGFRCGGWSLEIFLYR